MHTERGMRLSSVKVLGAMAAPAASNATMRCSVASFLHGRLQRIQRLGCVRLQDATLQVHLESVYDVNFDCHALLSDSIYLRVLQCAPVLIRRRCWLRAAARSSSFR